MLSVLLILPDFLVILAGFLLRRQFEKTVFNGTFWKGAEKLVFYVLFPPLLFTSVATSNLTLSEAGEFLAVAISAMLCAVVLSYLIRFIIKADDVTHASAFHCGFRFNTYVGFALVSRLYGQEGLALMSLLIAFWVPISNTIAVAVLAHAVARRDAQQNHASGRGLSSRQVLTSTVSAVVRNPLIIATVCGLLFNISGLTIPGVALDFMRHLGSASLAMGLLCIGAGLQVKGLTSGLKVLAAATFVRLVVISLFALVLIHVFELPATAAGVLLIFASLPTGQSCYVMTANMRGDAPAVANLTTMHTVAAMVTLPIWISLFIL